MLAATLVTTSSVLGSGGLTYPFTIAFNSVSVGRAIEISLDSNVYFTPQYDKTLPEQIVVSISSPIASMRFTGNVGDTVHIQKVVLV